MAPTPTAFKVKTLQIPDDAVSLKGAITFIGRKVIGSHDFVFKTWSGFAQLKDQQIKGSTIAFQIETASVVADPDNRGKWTPKLEKHMKDPDFFDVERFPTANFKSSSITPDPKGGPDNFKVVGMLTIKGISQEIAFPATIKAVDGQLAAEAKITINR